jgi:hypothetical protein
MFAIGMDGLVMPQRISRAAARADGVSLGLEGDALADFITLVKAIDTLEWGAAIERKAKHAADERKRNQQKTQVANGRN